MSDFHVVVLGVGDTFSQDHYPTSLLLSCDGFLLAIDCPDMYRRVLKDARARLSEGSSTKSNAAAGATPVSVPVSASMSPDDLDLRHIHHVLLTHVHGDHMNGREGVAFYKRFVEGRRLHLITTAEVREVLWDQRLRASMGTLWDGTRHREMQFDDYFECTILDWAEVNHVGPYAVSLRRTIHHVPTCALRVEAGGRTLGYSCDTAFDPTLIDFLASADLIIHETNMGPAHTAHPALMSLPEDVRARMRLIHYPDFFQPSHSPFPLLREGQCLSV